MARKLQEMRGKRWTRASRSCSSRWRSGSGPRARRHRDPDPPDPPGDRRSRRHHRRIGDSGPIVASERIVISGENRFTIPSRERLREIAEVVWATARRSGRRLGRRGCGGRRREDGSLRRVLVHPLQVLDHAPRLEPREPLVRHPHHELVVEVDRDRILLEHEVGMEDLPLDPRRAPAHGDAAEVGPVRVRPKAWQAVHPSAGRSPGRARRAAPRPGTPRRAPRRRGGWVRCPPRLLLPAAA